MCDCNTVNWIFADCCGTSSAPWSWNISNGTRTEHTQPKIYRARALGLLIFRDQKIYTVTHSFIHVYIPTENMQRIKQLLGLRRRPENKLEAFSALNPSPTKYNSVSVWIYLPIARWIEVKGEWGRSGGGGAVGERLSWGFVCQRCIPLTVYGYDETQNLEFICMCAMNIFDILWSTGGIFSTT